MQPAGIIVGLIVFGAAFAFMPRGAWSLLPVGLAIAAPVIVLLTAHSTQDDSPQSFAVVAVVLVSAPLVLGVAIGSGVKVGLRSRRRPGT
jgi:hypothetical protein